MGWVGQCVGQHTSTPPSDHGETSCTEKQNLCCSFVTCTFHAKLAVLLYMFYKVHAQKEAYQVTMCNPPFLVIRVQLVELLLSL